MRVCMVSPHLPPEQSANALLPAMLGEALASHGVRAEYVSHPPVAGFDMPAALDVSAQAALNVGTTYVPRRGRDRFSRSRVGAVVAGSRMALGARHRIRSSDLVHLHSNGFIVEIGEWLARKYRRRCVVTLYGTDISAYDPNRNARFGRIVREADCRVFYSRGLLKQAMRAGLAPDPSSVIYAPVSSAFRPLGDRARQSLRRELGVGDDTLLLTVKRLHPVAGHGTLLEALPAVLRRVSSARLWLAGDGELRSALEQRCRELRIAPHVRFLGRVGNELLQRYYAAADLFVLPSLIESWGTVMVESLACGTPVVTTDTIGGLEVRENFPEDVTVVQKASADDLAAGICVALERRARSTTRTLDLIKTFSVESCAARYLEIYREALGSQRYT